VVVLAHHLNKQGVLEKIEQGVRFARKRMGTYDTIDFVSVLIGYALSGEDTLEEFYEHLQPFATAFMQLFRRNELPSRSALSRFLSALDWPTVEALRALFEKDLISRPLIVRGETSGGLRDRRGGRWVFFDVDGTRQAARQRALPCTSELPSAQRRMQEVCAPGHTGRKRGEVVRTRTTILQAHTHQWFGTFGGSGNGDYRGELQRAIKSLVSYLNSQGIPLDHAIVRLDGQYGDGAIVADFNRYGLGYLMRGRDYQLLDLPALQARLAQPPEQVVTHPETGTTRALFDCPDVPLSPAGPRMRVIVATHPQTSTPARVGITREGFVYELFFTRLPQSAFTPADVLDLYQHRGAFEIVLCDEDKEQDPDRWVSHTPSGQEFWQILAQWMWNMRLEMGHCLHPTPMRTTQFAPAQTQGIAVPLPVAPPPVVYGPPQWSRTIRKGIFAGTDFRVQPDGTLLCPAEHPLYAREQRKEENGAVRVVYSARLAHCRDCPLREQCLGNGEQTKDARRVSALRRPIQGPPPPPLALPSLPPATEPLLWGDWSRTQTRRSFTSLLRRQTVTITHAPVPSSPQDMADPGPITRQERIHCRLSWAQRLARNACRAPTPRTLIHLFGIPTSFALSLGFA
jgi:hypothetical protein